ncbi:MAG: PD-(D/E)XK nuclease family protein [Ilumatobacteraceae bacterium]
MFPVPTSLSPSRVESFLSCPMAFRFASIEKLPEPPSVHTTRGSLVHRALELLFTRPAAARTIESALVALDEAITEYASDPDFTDLHLTDAEAAVFFDECRQLVHGYFEMENPQSVREIGLELRLEAPVGELLLRGIIDRLELDGDGELVVTDYKTGRAPSANWEQKSLSGVHFYSFLCEALFGRRPSKIRLMYLKTGETIEATPSAQSVRFVTTRTQAVLKAVEKACTTGSFQPRPSALCNGCAFKQWCPAFGGTPDLASVEAPRSFSSAAA